ncbi:hypothetical protein BH23ACT6_BH23ACT6_10070 [soil metagenome]
MSTPTIYALHENPKWFPPFARRLPSADREPERLVSPRVTKGWVGAPRVARPQGTPGFCPIRRLSIPRRSSLGRPYGASPSTISGHPQVGQRV